MLPGCFEELGTVVEGLDQVLAMHLCAGNQLGRPKSLEVAVHESLVGTTRKFSPVQQFRPESEGQPTCR